MGQLSDYASSLHEEYCHIGRDFVHNMDDSCKEWNDGPGIVYRNNIVRPIAERCENSNAYWSTIITSTAQIEAFIDAVLNNGR